MQQLFLEDLQPGQIFPSVSRALTDAHFTLFSDLTGESHPIHYDVEYARAQGWKGTVAHGLLLASMCALGAAPISHALSASMIAMVGTEVRYRVPPTSGIRFTRNFPFRLLITKARSAESCIWRFHCVISDTNLFSTACILLC